MSVVVLPHKLVPLEIGHTGLLPGRMVTKIDIRPSEISVVGEKELLDATEVIRLEPFDITDRTETFPTTVNVVPPDGLTLKEGEPDTVSVTFTIEPLMTKEFAFPTARIRRIGDNEYSMRFANNDDIPITIQGAESVITEMTNDDINAEVDISGLDVGEHTLPLKVTTTKQDTGPVNAPMVTVIITDIPPDLPEMPLDGDGIPMYSNGSTDEGQTGEGLPGLPGDPVSGGLINSGIMNGNGGATAEPPDDGNDGGAGADGGTDAAGDGDAGADSATDIIDDVDAGTVDGTDTTDGSDAAGAEDITD
jgi:hypothetical protein